MKFSNHLVTVSELFIEWTEPVQVYGFISSTLVDRNAYNPKQKIFQFCQEQPSNHLYRTPTHLILHAKLLSPKEAYDLGIINKLLSPENFMEDLKLYCQDLANRSPIALTQVKKIIHQGLDVTLEEGLMLEQKAFNVTMNSKDAAKAMRSLLNSDENIEDVTKFKWEGE